MRKPCFGLICATLALGGSLFAGNRKPELNVVLSNAITRLDREASADMEGPMLLAGLLEKEFGTREDELKWSVDQKMNWGEIATLAYIQATTGKSFAQINKE